MKYFKEFILTAFLGLTALLLINLFGEFIGVYLKFSYINMAFSGVLGIPGVIGLLIFENFIL